MRQSDGDVLLWSVTTAARKLGRHRCTIWRWIKDGNLRTVRFKGSRTMVVVESVHELIQQDADVLAGAKSQSGEHSAPVPHAD